MRLTSTGLGIGTSSPAYPLQVRRPGGGGSLGISIDGVGSTERTVQYFSIQDDATGAGAGHAFYYRAPGSTTNTFGFMLDEGGNLGIGTSSPGARLNVSGGNVYIQSSGAYTEPATVAGVLAFDNTNGDFNISARSNGGSTFMRFFTSNAGTGAERMRIDSSGNLGLGVTPSAWVIYKALQISGQTSIASTGNYAVFASNWFNNGAERYITTGNATRYYQGLGAHVWETAPSGTAGNAISFTQAMTLDASNNLAIGTTTPDVFGRSYGGRILALSGGASQNAIVLNSGSGTAFIEMGVGGTRSASLNATASAANLQAVGAIPLVFATNGTNRARITSAGDFITNVNAAAPALDTNSTMSFELTSNTSLKIVVRGTDGATRSVTLTLA
jgi:hypothetical protein